jgi:hypothetical protein
MVNLEAARAICDIPDASMKELHPAIAGKTDWDIGRGRGILEIGLC